MDAYSVTSPTSVMNDRSHHSDSSATSGGVSCSRGGTVGAAAVVVAKAGEGEERGFWKSLASREGARRGK